MSDPTEQEASTDGRLRNRLAAVQLLLGTDRIAAEHDIIISTVSEALRSGGRTSEELTRFTNEVWPGCAVRQVQIEAALATGKAAGLFTEVRQLDSSLNWELATSSGLDLELSDVWSAQVVERCESFLKDRASQAFGECDPETAHLWMLILEDAIFAGVRAAFSESGGSARVVGGSLLAPKGYDLDLMNSIVDEHCKDEEIALFLKTIVIEAMEPTNPFATELVHTIATGYVLNAFLARRDHPTARMEVGSLRGQVILLDTPILLRLLGSSREADMVWQTMAATHDEGVEILVHLETIDELRALLNRLQDTARSIEEDLTSGKDSATTLAPFVDPPLRIWLEKRGLEEVGGWSDFCGQIDAVVARLRSIGCDIRKAANAYTLVQSAWFAQFESALESTLAAKNSKRGTQQVRHDAYLLVALKSLRDDANSDVLWPGATVVTSDSAITPTYRAVTGETDMNFPAAITLSQWLGIVTQCAEPGVAESLAQTVPAEVAYETLLSIAVRFPIESSRTLARVLTEGNASSPTDLRIAQMTIDDVIKDQPELTDNPAQAGNQVASQVIAQQSRRIQLAASHQRDFAKQEAERSTRESEISKALAKRESEARESAENLAVAVAKRAEAAEAERDAALLRARRMPRIYGLIVLAVILAIAFLVFGLYGFFVGTVISAGVLWRQGDEWAKNKDRSWLHLLTALVPEILGVIDFFRR